MAAGKINLQKASGGITAITGIDGVSNTNLVLPESGTVATTAGATETSTGLVELATTAETRAGTDDTRAITPLKLKNSVLGLGQTWQDMTASRTAGTTYTNSTGKPILINCFNSSSATASYAALTINDQIIAEQGMPSASGYYFVSGICPNGGTYSLSANGTSQKWLELR